jgi:hypothetical protein
VSDDLNKMQSTIVHHRILQVRIVSETGLNDRRCQRQQLGQASQGLLLFTDRKNGKLNSRGR